MFDNIFFWAQIIGFIAMVLRIASWQLKSSRDIIFSGLPIQALWTIHYLMLGANIGAFMNIVSAVRDGALTFIKERHVLWLSAISLSFAWIVGLYLLSAWYDLLPLLGSSITACSLAYRDNRPLVARGAVFSSCFWITYNFIAGSWMGVMCASLVILSSIIGMYRHEEWKIGNCYRSFLPNLTHALFDCSKLKTYP